MNQTIDNPYNVKALKILRAMLNNAKSIEDVNQVKFKCELARVKYHLLSLDEDSFRLAIENDVIENFYE